MISPVRRSLLLTIGPCPVLKEVPFGTKDYGGHIIPKRHKALTVKKIEVEPYKWLKELDETVDQDGEIFSLRALTEKLSVQQGSNEQFSDLYSAWQGFKDLILNPTKYMVALGEFNVECAKSVLERHGFA